MLRETANTKSIQVGEASQILDEFLKHARANPQAPRTLVGAMLDAVSLSVIGMGRRCRAVTHSFPYVDPQDAPTAVVPGAMMIMAQQSTEVCVTGLIDAVGDLAMAAQGERLWLGISLPVMVIGVLFPFLIPPIFYSVMGADIVYMGPLLCLIVTGAVLFNICMASPLRSPNTHHMGHVYDCLYQIADTVDEKHARAFPISTIVATSTGDDFNVRIADNIMRREKDRFMLAAEKILIPRVGASRND